jgi:serine/threonine protein kinase
VVLDAPYDFKIDIWSYGAVLAEMLTGYVLFQNDSIPTMLARIIGILGPFPERLLRAGNDTINYFTVSVIFISEFFVFNYSSSSD